MKCQEHETTAMKAMILSAAAEEIDRGETTNASNDCGGGSKTK